MKNKKYILLILAVLIFETAVILLPKQNQTSYQLQKNCDNIPDLDKKACFDSLIDYELKNKSLDSTLVLMQNLYQKYSQFATDCHGYAHELGQKFYNLYVKTGRLELSDKADFCGYGFYHGFMDEAILQSHDLSLVTKLCDKVTEKLSPILSDACYHGVGHGALEAAISSPIKPQADINTALATCSKITHNSTQQERCASGIFMQYSNYATAGQIPLDAKNPLSVCETQKESEKMACYTQLNGVLAFVSKGNVLDASKFIDGIGNDDYAKYTMEDLMGVLAGGQSSELSNEVNSCRLVSDRLHLSCIRGIALGIMLKSAPGNEFDNAKSFCSLKDLNINEQQACFELVTTQVKNLYPKEKQIVLCSEIPTNFSKFCYN